MAGKSDRATALDLGYLLMRAGFTREEVLEVIRIKNENADKEERLIETGYQNRREVSDRLRQLKDAGFHGQAADLADGTINVIVDGGKRGLPLNRVPPRKLLS